MSLRHRRLFGDILKTYVGSELRLTETLCAPGFRAPRHSHELFQFCFIIEGGFSEKCGQKMRECAPLTLITHPPDETHANSYYSSGAHCFVVEIEHRWLSRSREYSLALDRSAEFNYGSSVWLAKRLYDEFYRMDRASPLVIEGITLEMMAEVSRRHVKTSEGTSPRWLEQTRDLSTDEDWHQSVHQPSQHRRRSSCRASRRTSTTSMTRSKRTSRASCWWTPTASP